MFPVYPQSDAMRGERGLNLADTLQNISYQYTLKSQNCFFSRRTTRRRHGFTRRSTETWTGVWRGGMHFADSYGNTRLLVGRNGGTIEEVQSASAHATVVSGLTAGNDIHMAAAFGSVFVVNGVDRMRRIDATSSAATACTSRIAGQPAAPSGFTAVAGAAGGRTGDYAFCATAVIESGGLRLLESNWSSLVEVTLAAQAVTFGWTDPSIADPRVTHIYLYGTRTGGAEPYFIRKVALAATGYTNDNTLDAALGALAPSRNTRYAPPDAPELIATVGPRLVVTVGARAYFGNRAQNGYDAEGFSSRYLDIPAMGRIRAVRAVAFPGQGPATNSAFFGTESSCHILFEADPQNQLTLLSSELGVMNPRAITSRGKYLFFVDRRRGVMFWPGEGLDIFCISELINPVFEGGGNQSLTANISDDDVELAIWRDHLLLSVRDDSGKACANKVYFLNLLYFERAWLKAGPSAAAVWGGPWTGPGFGRLLPMLDSGLVVLDSENLTIVEWDSSTYRDYIAGTPQIATPRVRLGPAMVESQLMAKRMHRVYLHGYSGANSVLDVTVEEGRLFLLNNVLQARNITNLLLIDIPSIDLPVLSESGRSECPIDWAALGNWFQLEFYTSDGDNDWVFVGAQFRYTRHPVMTSYA